MFKKLAVLGTGAIGGMLGAYLTRAGLDVTMISAFRPETAISLQSKGISITGSKGCFTVPVKARYIKDLETDVFDCIFCALKSNDIPRIVPEIVPFLAKDGCFVTLQNGINEEFVTPILGKQRVIAGVSFAGGQQKDDCHFEDHDGRFVIGELDGQITTRAREICKILEAARPTEVSTEIRREQWTKLGTVAVHVPCCTLAGVGMQEAFEHPILQQIFPLLAMEIFEVAEADGYAQEKVMGRTRGEWLTGRSEPSPQMPQPSGKMMPPKIVDAYTKDIQRGAELEIDYTNGAVVRFGKRYGIDTPVNAGLIDALRGIESREHVAGDALAQSFLEKYQNKRSELKEN